MKKTSLLLSFAMVLFFAANVYAHQAVKTDGFSVAKDGLQFDGLIIAMEPQNRVGSLFFNPSNPTATPVNKNELDKANTIAVFKEQIVNVVNAKADRDPLTNYKPITVNDIAVYGGHALQTENSYTGHKVLAATKAGATYRVKITLTPKDEKQTIQTAIQGIFTLYAPQ